jgi:tryptophanyl-tRNA synthetase
METIRLLSGIKPSGQLHIGNYFGAMRQMLKLQDKYESFVFVADLHAFNQVHDPAALRSNILELIAAYLAIGLDPAKVTLFQQSAVPAHAQLCVILNGITSMGLLERSHAYKDALANGKVSNVGLFDYPVLMAADILLYKPAVVPVGKDQSQHVEIAVDLAQRFNHLFGKTFELPEALILPDVGIVPGLDGRKMSKSYSNVIGLFEEAGELRKKIFAIKTDSKTPQEPKVTENDTLFAMHRLFSLGDLSSLEKRYLEGGIGYKESKEILFDNINKFLDPIRKRYQEFIAQPKMIARVLATGNERAQAIASVTLGEVETKIGMR